jgi:hypothetical protein
VGKPASAKGRRKQWIKAAQSQLSPVIDAAALLRRATAQLPDASEDLSRDPSSLMLSASRKLLDWLHDTEAPPGQEETVAELRAAAGVHRNAALAFRRLADPTTGREETLARACESLLEQGEHHIARFESLAGGSPPLD